jgi:hypothetical protein
MREKVRKTALVVLGVALVSTTGCLPHTYRYRYLSFEDVPGVVVESVAPIEVENLVFGSTIPVEYSLAREGYTLLLSVDASSYSPNATVELRDSPGVRLVPRPSRGARADRPRPCGSYDDIAASGERFEFSWVICGDNASQEEHVVAFDVVDKDFGVKEEAVQFTLRSDGVYWLRDSL